MERYIKGCPSYKDYNVFGLQDKGCCYCYMAYCKDVKSCPIKEIIKKCKDNSIVKSNDILDILYNGSQI